MNARIFSLLSVCTVLLFISCSKKLPEPPDSDIWTIVSNSSDLSLFKYALTKDGMADTLKKTPNITLLAPTNDAFTTAGISQQSIDAMAKAQLHSLLAYHILGTTVGTSRFPTSDTVLTTQGTHIYISNNINGKFINGKSIKEGDIAATNGLIHKLNAVLRPLTDSLGKIIRTDPDLTFLNAAFQRTQLLLFNNAAGKYTLFAPTNAAFQKAGFNTIQDVTTADSATLVTYINYHIIGSNYCNIDLINAMQLTTLNSAGIIVTRSTPTGPITLKQTYRTAPVANVITTDSLAINGIVHKIDNLLLTK
ncbi:MAG: fasciclin domain-containing protein [Filimonas sp.]|nr:fasciclin domain-containing protein [Filimonas sp.]